MTENKFKSLKVTDIKKHLEESVNEAWVGKRFEDIMFVHDAVSHFATHVLPKELTVYPWKISLQSKEEWDLELFNYEFDFIEDKRYKWGVAGRFNKVTITPIFEVSEDATLEDLILQARKDVAEKSVQAMEEAVANLEKDLDEYKNRLEEKKKQLASLK